jgi:hypothetical protein
MPAEVHLELGEPDGASAIAGMTREAAQIAGNELDLASASVILGNRHLARRESGEARSLMEDQNAVRAPGLCR